MASPSYDLITIGGGFAGSALAKTMAENGARVLLIERETEFRDRVRGEAIMPWGTADAKLLGIYDVIKDAGGHELPFWDGYLGNARGNARTGHRNLLTTTVPKEPILACYHPTMQNALLQAAANAGAEVLRGSRVVGVKTNGNASVELQDDGGVQEIQARLIVASDGRGSAVRDWLGFEVHQAPEGNMVAGLLLDGHNADEDAAHAGLNPDLGMFVILFPQGNGRARSYVCYRAESGYRLSGEGDIPRFMEDLVRGGFPAEYFTSAKPAGPLATFSGAALWVENPYRNGVVLIGDAASHADPTWGQGLSLALRDVRSLRDQLLNHQDWDEAGKAYSEERKAYSHTVHTAEDWQTELLMIPGPEADAVRQRVFPLWQQDRTRNPDIFFNGPIGTLDETARRRFFGEE